MKLTLKYGEKNITIGLPSDLDQSGGSSNLVLEPRQFAKTDEVAEIRKALLYPECSVSFYSFLANPGDFIFIVNDGTRSTPTAKILDHMAKVIEELDARFIVATGTHRAPNEKELEFIFGDHLERFRDKILIHDSRDSKNVTNIGKTPWGNEILINNHVLETDNIVIIGSVEPHYFAGYTGGRKAFLPGVAGYESVRRNHAHALSEDAKVLALQGNPVHEEMAYVTKMIRKPIFSIQAVLDRDHDIYKIVAGDIEKSFAKAVDFAREVYTAEYAGLLDIALCEVHPPMDIDLYQSHKAIEHAKDMVKPGGTIILISQCREGIGPSVFFELLSSEKPKKQIIEEISENYTLGVHKTVKLLELLDKKHIAVFSSIKTEILQKTGMQSITDIQRFVDDLCKGGNRRITIIRDATVTVPIRK